MTEPVERVRATRPHAITSNDILLSLVLDELEHQGEMLGHILDRLPAPEPVEVTEPAPARRSGRPRNQVSGG